MNISKFALVILPVAISLAACTGGGETVVSGFGNSGNHFGEENVQVLLARAVARHPGTPEITDQELAATLEALKSEAMRGNPDAALVMYRVAAHQRAAKAEQEQGDQ